MRSASTPTRWDVALVLPSDESVRTVVEAGAGIAALSALDVSHQR